MSGPTPVADGITDTDMMTFYTRLHIVGMLVNFQEKLQRETDPYQGDYRINLDILLHSLCLLEKETLQYSSPQVLRIAVGNGDFTAFGATGLSLFDRLDAVLKTLKWQSLRDELYIVSIDFFAWVAEQRGQLNLDHLISVMWALHEFLYLDHRPRLTPFENKKLCFAIMAILAGYGPEVKNTDCAVDDPDTVWHTLFSYSALLATHSQDTALMERVFLLFIAACPPRAIADFFQFLMQGIPVFPDEVKKVVKTYCQRYGNYMTVH